MNLEFFRGVHCSAQGGDGWAVIGRPVGGPRLSADDGALLPDIERTVAAAETVHVVTRQWRLSPTAGGDWSDCRRRLIRLICYLIHMNMYAK